MNWGVIFRLWDSWESIISYSFPAKSCLTKCISFTLLINQVAIFFFSNLKSIILSILIYTDWFIFIHYFAKWLDEWGTILSISYRRIALWSCIANHEISLSFDQQRFDSFKKVIPKCSKNLCMLFFILFTVTFIHG